jgi:2-amino-1-hydroxyethylphosphonate dioxygenase (glycine-forming)
MNCKIESVLDQVFEPYLKHGADDYIGEPVSQIEHMSQCAELARRQGHDDEVILAAFFHDLGHICAKYDETDNMGGYGRISHEKVGADFLRIRGFSEKIATLVERHVETKRYLCARSTEYYKKLSPASKQTLIFQGGPMSAAEVAAFENDPLHSLYIELRAWDELAKQQNHPVPDLDIYRSMARKHLQQQNAVS